MTFAQVGETSVTEKVHTQMITLGKMLPEVLFNFYRVERPGNLSNYYFGNKREQD